MRPHSAPPLSKAPLNVTTHHKTLRSFSTGTDTSGLFLFKNFGDQDFARKSDVRTASPSNEHDITEVLTSDSRNFIIDIDEKTGFVSMTPMFPNGGCNPLVYLNVPTMPEAADPLPPLDWPAPPPPPVHDI